MRKILFLTVALSVSFTLVSVATAAESGPGCGLGKIIFEGSSGLLAHTSAKTTNGSTSNQYFAITSGTSGCNADGVVKSEMEAEVFLAFNYDSFSQQMAQGQGQYVDAMASLMGCNASVYPEFGKMGQQKYDLLFRSPNEDSKAVIAAVKQEMAANPMLASNCQRVS